MGIPKHGDYLVKRDLLNNPSCYKNVLLDGANSCLEDEFLHDALEFFKKAKESAGIEQILKQAIEDGDVFLVAHALEALKKEFSNDEWINVGRRAESLGKYVFAAQAYRKAGADEEAARLLLLTERGPNNERGLDTSPEHA